MAYPANGAASTSLTSPGRNLIRTQPPSSSYVAVSHDSEATVVVGFGGGAAYSTSKAAQICLSSSAAADLAPHGIRVNLVTPGFVKTEMHDRIRGIVTDEGMDGMIAGMVPLQRAGDPEELARTLVWLCSDEASYVNATTLTVDGGLHGTL